MLQNPRRPLLTFTQGVQFFMACINNHGWIRARLPQHGYQKNEIYNDEEFIVAVPPPILLCALHCAGKLNPYALDFPLCTGDKSADGSDKGAVLRAQRLALKRHMQKALSKERGVAGDDEGVPLPQQGLLTPYDPCAEDLTVPWVVVGLTLSGILIVFVGVGDWEKVRGSKHLRCCPAGSKNLRSLTWPWWGSVFLSFSVLRYPKYSYKTNRPGFNHPLSSRVFAIFELKFNLVLIVKLYRFCFFFVCFFVMFHAFLFTDFWGVFSPLFTVICLLCRVVHHADIWYHS